MSAASTCRRRVRPAICQSLTSTGKERCPYLPPHDEPAKLETFRDHALSQPSAIEDLEDLGRRLHTCTWASRSEFDASGPYYGSRKAIRSAQLVAMPYQLLLSTTARDALGIDLAGQIVVIDEAHALIDTVLGQAGTVPVRGVAELVDVVGHAVVEPIDDAQVEGLGRDGGHMREVALVPADLLLVRIARSRIVVQRVVDL